MASVNTNPTSIKVLNVSFVEKYPECLDSDSSCCCCPPGGNLQPWPPTATSAGPSSLPTGDAAELLTLFQDTRPLDLFDLDRIYFPHSWIHEFTRYWPKYPLCDFLGHHGLSLMEGYFNPWDAGYLTEIVDTCSPFSLLSSLSRNPISPLIIIDFQSLAQEETRTSAKGLES